MAGPHLQFVCCYLHFARSTIWLGLDVRVAEFDEELISQAGWANKVFPFVNNQNDSYQIVTFTI